MYGKIFPLQTTTIYNFSVSLKTCRIPVADYVKFKNKIKFKILKKKKKKKKPVPK